MQDQKLAGVERTLTSALVVISSATQRAESLRDQALADDLHDLQLRMKAIVAGIGSHGQAYKSPSTTVRN